MCSGVYWCVYVCVLPVQFTAAHKVQIIYTGRVKFSKHKQGAFVQHVHWKAGPFQTLGNLKRRKNANRTDQTKANKDQNSY